ncbi:MAG: oligosaccharide flippase family protein [Fervidobacterium sp.]
MADEMLKIAEDSTRGGFFLVIGTALSTLIVAIASIIIARFLGPELYGQYTLALVTPQLLFLFTDLGINQGIIKYAADLRQKGEGSRIIKIIEYGMLLRAAAGIGIFILNYALSDMFASLILQRPDLAYYVKIASTSILFQVIFTTATSSFVGLDKTEYNALTANVQAISKAIISVALVLLGFSVSGAIVGHVVSYVIATIAGATLLIVMLRDLKRCDCQKIQNNSNDLKILVSYGAPLYLSLLLTGLVPSYQSIILAFFTTDVEIGNFKAASNFIALMAVLTTPITTALLPAFSKLSLATSRKVKAFFKVANKYTTMIILPATFLIIILSGEIVQIVYGSTYQFAPVYLATYCLVYLLTGFGYLTLTSLFNGLGDTKTTLKISLITFIGITVLSPILTKNYSVQGSIVSLIIANMAGTLYSVHAGKRKLQIEFNTRSIIKVYLTSALSSIPTLILLQLAGMPNLLNIIIGGLLYLLTYVTLIPLTKTVTTSEIRKAANITQKIKPLWYITKLVFQYQQKIIRVTTNL